MPNSTNNKRLVGIRWRRWRDRKSGSGGGY